jgi:hypothetical protein
MSLPEIAETLAHRHSRASGDDFALPPEQPCLGAITAHAATARKISNRQGIDPRNLEKDAIRRRKLKTPVVILASLVHI